MAKSVPLPKLISELAETLRTYDRLVFDEELSHELAEPASSNQIATLEKILGHPLPPSYQEFLKLHNGWSNFVGDAKLLGTDDHNKEWVKEKLEKLDTLFYEFGENPFKLGAIPIMLGEDARGFLMLDPRTVRSNGEMDFVSFHIVHEEDRFKDFTSFLQHKLKLLRESIKDEMEGVSDEDE